MNYGCQPGSLYFIQLTLHFPDDESIRDDATTHNNTASNDHEVSDEASAGPHEPVQVFMTSPNINLICGSASASGSSGSTSSDLRRVRRDLQHYREFRQTSRGARGKGGFPGADACDVRHGADVPRHGGTQKVVRVKSG